MNYRVALLLNCKLTTEPIEISISEYLYRGPRMVLGCITYLSNTELLFARGATASIIKYLNIMKILEL